MTEIRVSTQKLRNLLRELLRRVKYGDMITVIQYTRTVGQIVTADETIEERFQGMITSGAAEWNGKKLPPYQRQIVNHSTGTLSDLIARDRE